MNNFPKTEQIGSVLKVNPNSFNKIHLLIGGSPCQGFSFAGKQLNFKDSKSSLFFEFVRILNDYKPEYFLLENVRMKKVYKDIISKYLGVEPIEINSNSVSAQDRKRLYWTNIPISEKDFVPSKTCIEDILGKNIPEKYFLSERICERYRQNKNYELISTKSCVIGKLSKYQGDRVFDIKAKASSLSASGGNNGGGSCNIIWDKDRLRVLTPRECEILQNIPEGYTKFANTKSQRYKMIGNGWTIGIIECILNKLNNKKYRFKRRR